MDKRQVNFEQEEVEPMAGTTATDKNDLDDHRVYSFEALGFSKKDAKVLAETRYTSFIGDRSYDFPLSWHKVKKVLDAGCSHELALKIFV
jgi:hypothetical protein